MKRSSILIVSLFLMIGCTPVEQEDLGQSEDSSYSPRDVVPSGSGEYVLARTSTATSRVQVLTKRYESNLLKIISWLPERWDLVAVVKWSAYGNDINILGPVAARVAPALGVMSNEDAEALARHNPGWILRIGPTNYDLVKESVAKGLNIREFIGTNAELEAVTRVAKENKVTVDASIYLFDHYGDPWGFEFDTPEELQHLVDSIDPRLVKVQGIFSHLVINSEDTAASVNQRVNRFLRVACPVAVKVATTLTPEDPPVMVHWGASSELSRLRSPNSGKVELPSEVQDLADVCMSHPRVNFGIRVGSSTYGSVDDLPDLKPILRWTSKVKKLRRTATTTIAEVEVGTEDGYPRLFRKEGSWGKVMIGNIYYPLPTPPEDHKIEVDVGANPVDEVSIGADVCLICDKLSVDDLYEWVAVDTYNISMCATGAGPRYAEATSFSYDEDTPHCKGPVVEIPDEGDGLFVQIRNLIYSTITKLGF